MLKVINVYVEYVHFHLLLYIKLVLIVELQEAVKFQFSQEK